MCAAYALIASPSVERYARCTCNAKKVDGSNVTLVAAAIIAAALSFSDDCFAEPDSTQKTEKSAKSSDNSYIQKSFAIVKLGTVASRCKAGIDIERQMTEINDQSKKGHLELEDKIKSMEHNKTSDFDNRKIEEMQLILYDMVRTKKQQISDAYRNAISELERVIRQSAETIAVRDGICIAVESDVVVYASKDCRDITEDVIKEVDNTCQSIKVEMKE
ncbi:hypothetical protein FACS189449_06700 [Alphaproteobacteria bacterium]|nr:hypothetical protein FACS189449_06700 [Alphaproteobacteria bacterium]